MTGMPTAWRKRVEVYIRAGNRIIVADAGEGNLIGVGGGIESGQSLEEAARTECLEEAGADIEGVRVLNPGTPYRLDWSNGMVPTRKDSRRTQYHGAMIYYATADFAGWNTTLLGRDGDAKEVVSVAKTELLSAMQKYKDAFCPEFAEHRINLLKNWL